MSKLPEKGILKKHGYGAVDGKDKWGDDSQSEQLEAGSQSDGQEPAGAVADMEYKFKVSRAERMRLLKSATRCRMLIMKTLQQHLNFRI